MSSFVKNLKHAEGKNPSSSCSIFKHGNIAFLKTTHALNFCEYYFHRIVTCHGTIVEVYKQSWQI